MVCINCVVHACVWMHGCKCKHTTICVPEGCKFDKSSYVLKFLTAKFLLKYCLSQKVVKFTSLKNLNDPQPYCFSVVMFIIAIIKESTS